MRSSETDQRLSKQPHTVHLGVSPPSRASRRTMACVSPAQSVLCASRSSPAFMEAIGCVQHSTSAAVCVINHRVKLLEQNVPEVERERAAGLTGTPGTHDAPSRRPSVANKGEKRGKKTMTSGLHQSRGEI